MADPITYADFAKLELRVAKVLQSASASQRRPADAPSSRLGDEQKQIVAGIRHHS